MLRSILLVVLVLMLASKHAMSSAVSGPLFVDPACIATVDSKTRTSLSSANKRLSSPTFFELKIEMQKNLSKFFATRLTAINIQTGSQCENPIGNASCTIVGYKNPDGSAVTVDGVYSFVVYAALYKYFSEATLDSGSLEAVRSDFSAGYAGLDTRPFADIMRYTISESGVVADMSNKSASDIITIIDTASTNIAEKMSADGLFMQKLGYSSLVRFPIASRLIECLDGTFRNLFMRDISKTLRRTPYGVAQDYFKPVVILALILYFIAYGYRIVMAQGMGKQSEIIMFGIKFALVFYFSIGDAWKDFAFDMLKSFPATVTQIMFSSMLDVGDGCSAFTPNMYPQGKGMIAFFDMIDCKYANYIGMPANGYVPGLFYAMAFTFLMPIPILGVLLATMTTIYFAMVTYGILIGLEIYVSSMLYLTFYLFLSPIIVPMALFSVTKGIFEKYKTFIMGTVVQSIMSVVLLVFIVSLMDKILYGVNPQSPKHNMFVGTQQFIQGVPQPIPVNQNCYDNNSSKAVGVDSDGVTPFACVLSRVANTSHAWMSFPIPYVIEIFDLPNPFSFIDKLLAYLVPCIMALFGLFVLQTITSKLSGIIDQISKAQSISTFGASKYSATKEMMKAATNAKKATTDTWNSVKSLIR